MGQQCDPPAVVREVAASADAVTRTFAVKLALQGEQAAAAALGSTAYVQLQSLPAGSLASAQQQATAARTHQGAHGRFVAWGRARQCGCLMPPVAV